MDPREELAALRRMAELEAKASGQSYSATPTASESGTPAPRKATTAELALASPPARIALGLASPLVGAVQVGANVGDWINEKIGQKPVVSKAIADWWNNVQAMKERGMASPAMAVFSPETMIGQKPVDIAGTLAGMALPMGAAGKANTVMQAVKEGAKVGAITGAAQPGTEKLGDQAVGAAVGGTIGAAAPIAIPAAAKAAGWVMDAASGNLFQIKAGKVLRQISGDKLPEIRAALAQANPDLNAAQAVQEAGVTAPVFQAMGARGAQERSGPAAERMLREEAGRMNALQKVTPDLQNALAARSSASGPLYTQAESTMASVTPELASVFERLPKGTLEKAAEIARMDNRPFILGKTTPATQVPSNLVDANGVPFSTTIPAQNAKISGESLHYIKRALSDISNASPTTGMGRDTQQAARNVLSDFLNVVESPSVLPVYGTARQTHAEMSKPVNQAQVLNQMAAVLQKPGGGERVTPFLNVLGRGEDALLKRANQSPRFGGLEDVLTPEQMQTTNDIARQLTRDAEMERLAGMGSRQLAKILKEEPTSLPPTGKAAIVFNRVANALKGKVSDKTMDALAKGMESGADASALMATLPAVERNAVLKAMTDAKMWASKAGIGLSTGAASGTVNMMRPKEFEIQNALVK